MLRSRRSRSPGDGFARNWKCGAGRAAPMNWARAFAFNIAFFTWTMALGTIGVPVLLGPPAAAMRFGRFWSRGVLWLLRSIVGLDYRIRGLAHLPPGPCIVAMKHQSAWETIVLSVIFENPVPVVKRNLLRLPFYGWYAYHAGSIGIDRKGRAGALRQMIAAARRYAGEGRP